MEIDAPHVNITTPIDVEWEDMPNKGRLVTLKEWMIRNPEVTLWRLAWVLWWRILLMAIGTAAIVGIPIAAARYG